MPHNQQRENPTNSIYCSILFHLFINKLASNQHLCFKKNSKSLFDKHVFIFTIDMQFKYAPWIHFFKIFFLSFKLMLLSKKKNGHKPSDLLYIFYANHKRYFLLQQTA